jgi:aspartate carbamoyltransferase catalytic subunit
MSLTEEFKAELRQYNLNFKEADHVEQAIAEADVILVEPVVQPDYTKSRDERAGKEVGMTPANYKITRELLGTKAKSDAILLHSLPRMDEIPPDVDITRNSRYWQEAFNGVVMRMALLALVLGAME